MLLRIVLFVQIKWNETPLYDFAKCTRNGRLHSVDIAVGWPPSQGSGFANLHRNLQCQCGRYETQELPHRWRVAIAKLYWPYVVNNDFKTRTRQTALLNEIPQANTHSSYQEEFYNHRPDGGNSTRSNERAPLAHQPSSSHSIKDKGKKRAKESLPTPQTSQSSTAGRQGKRSATPLPVIDISDSESVVEIRSDDDEQPMASSSQVKEEDSKDGHLDGLVRACEQMEGMLDDELPTELLVALIALDETFTEAQKGRSVD